MKISKKSYVISLLFIGMVGGAYAAGNPVEPSVLASLKAMRWPYAAYCEAVASWEGKFSSLKSFPDAVIPATKKDDIKHLCSKYGFTVFIKDFNMTSYQGQPYFGIVAGPDSELILLINKEARLLFYDVTKQSLVMSFLYHELGHGVAGHYKKRIVVESLKNEINVSTALATGLGVTGCALKMADSDQRALACCAGVLAACVTYCGLYNYWDRFRNAYFRQQERDADYFAGTLMDDEQLVNDWICFLNTTDKQSPVTTHPHPDERIAFFKKVFARLKAAHKNS